ncbi:flavoprotein [Baffinella frigidus]|nr:flavoprotein [Cryptophyta sp. CCMP2293]
MGGHGVHGQHTVAAVLQLRGGEPVSGSGEQGSQEQTTLSDASATGVENSDAGLRGGGVDRPPRVLLGLSGSVAAIKAEELVKALSAFADVRVVTTAKAAHFFSPEALTAACHVEVLTDADEWAAWQGRGDPVQHIELRRWADLFIIAPISANTLAKLAGGLCDNLLTCVARAWEYGKKPLVIAPAMNTAMWEHPATAPHLATLHSWGALSIPPVAKLSQGM